MANPIAEILDAAANGQLATRKELLRARVHRDLVETVYAASREIAAVSVGGEPDLAKKLARQATEEILAMNDSEVDLEKIDRTSGVGDNRPPGLGKEIADHPAWKVLTQVADGRRTPTTDELKALGFTHPAAYATWLAARTTTALRVAGSARAQVMAYAETAAAEIARNHPWQKPDDDDWSSIEPDPDLLQPIEIDAIRR